MKRPCRLISRHWNDTNCCFFFLFLFFSPGGRRATVTISRFKQRRDLICRKPCCHVQLIKKIKKS